MEYQIIRYCNLERTGNNLAQDTSTEGTSGVNEHIIAEKRPSVNKDFREGGGRVHRSNENHERLNERRNLN